MGQKALNIEVRVCDGFLGGFCETLRHLKEHRVSGTRCGSYIGKLKLVPERMSQVCKPTGDSPTQPGNE